MSLRYDPIYPPSPTTQKSTNTSLGPLKKMEKLRLKRYIESKLKALKKDLQRQQEMQDDSISRIFNHILSEDSFLNTSLSSSLSKKSFYYSKENIAENLEDVNILDLMSSGQDGESILNYYKRVYIFLQLQVISFKVKSQQYQFKYDQ